MRKCKFLGMQKKILSMQKAQKKCYHCFIFAYRAKQKEEKKTLKKHINRKYIRKKKHHVVLLLHTSVVNVSMGGTVKNY